MKWHKIEIDNDVFEYLKKLAEPFTDTPNSVLRRELLNERRTTAITPRNSEITENDTGDLFQAGTPVALQHILEVVRLVRRGAYERSDATHFVAKKHRVFPQTVQDKYGRQLGLTADAFDRLLGKADSNDLLSILINKFPSYGDIIRKYLTA